MINTLSITILTIFIIWIAREAEQDAMNVCQLSHSEAVCFQAINR